MKLGFNIDHVATLRNARNEGYPNLIKVAKLAIKAGAGQITAHLREDRRHIKDDDILDLKHNINVPLNMEMAATEEMLSIALKIKPYSVCFVPEKRNEITTESGINVINKFEELKVKIQNLRLNNIKSVLFIDPEKEQLRAAIDLNVFGVEFNTGKYSNAYKEDKIVELDKIYKMSLIATKFNVEAHAGHGLNYDNVKDIAAIKEIIELNIGHFLVSEALFVGIENSIKGMVKIINDVRK